LGWIIFNIELKWQPMRYPIARPTVGEEEVSAVASALRAAEISRGSSIQQFESGFSGIMGAGEAVSVVNGTAALELALRALGLTGKQVITGAMSCQATANALVAAGCEIRFADHDPRTWQVSLDSIRDVVDSRTTAVVVAHLYGATTDLSELAAFCKDRGLLLIEDCSQSFGARWQGRLAGAFGDVSTFSFYGNKLITTGEGGMLWTHSSDVAAQARLLRNHGQDRPFHHVAYALNWKMPNLLAALGVEQLRRIPDLIAARKERAHRLRGYLSDQPDIMLPKIPPELEAAPFCFPLILRGHDRDQIARELADEGIETRPLFPPQYAQPYWSSLIAEVSAPLPIAEDLSAKGLYLSTSPHLSLDDCDAIATVLIGVLARSTTMQIAQNA
jgi:perosamine synthetase